MVQDLLLRSNRTK